MITTVCQPQQAGVKAFPFSLTSNSHALNSCLKSSNSVELPAREARRILERAFVCLSTLVDSERLSRAHLEPESAQRRIRLQTQTPDLL